MITEPYTPVPSEPKTLCAAKSSYPALCWKAILGGTVAAIGIHILLMALGVGSGLGAFTPMTDANPAENFSLGAAVAWSLCALVALAFGGFLAGRYSHSHHSGFVHGVLVWCATLILTLLLVSAGTGMVMGGALKVLGQGVGLAGKTAASGTAELAKASAGRSADQLHSFIDEAVQSGPTNAAPRALTQANREIGFALTKLFAPGNEANSADNRKAAIQALAQYSGMSEPDATKAVDGWMASAKNLKAELDNLKEQAESKARAAADAAAHNLSRAAIWSFFALLAGLLVAAFSGRCGAVHALRGLDFQPLAENNAPAFVPRSSTIKPQEAYEAH